jgi:hypothetical protein
MSSKKFIATFFLGVFLFFSVYFLTSISRDDFSLFWSCEDRKVVAYEKLSKWLFSNGCFISKYDSYMFGTSASSLNFNSAAFKKGQFYNMSLNGGDVSDTADIFYKLNSRLDVKNVIFGLIPSYTQNDGNKPLDPDNVKWRYLFSSDQLKLLYKYYVFNSESDQVFENSYRGDTTSGHLDISKNSYQRINGEASYILKNIRNYFDISEQALRKLDELLFYSHANNINVVGFFYPYPDILLKDDNFRTKYDEYRQIFSLLFSKYGYQVINFNNSDHGDYFDNSDYGNYFNSHHLSSIGALKVSDHLNDFLTVDNISEFYEK